MVDSRWIERRIIDNPYDTPDCRPPQPKPAKTAPCFNSYKPEQLRLMRIRKQHPCASKPLTRGDSRDVDHHSRFGFKVKYAQVHSRIKDYALIGDCETAALVSKTGSIDWLCWPDFSSPACFAALLGTPSNGCWQLAPTQRFRSQRRYRNHTLILETTFSTRTGKVKVTDWMPIRGKHSDVVRLVHGVEGRVSMTMELALRFDYGRSIPWLQHPYKHDFLATAGPGTAYLRTPRRSRI